MNLQKICRHLIYFLATLFLVGCATHRDLVKDHYVYHPQIPPGQNMNGVEQDLARLLGTERSPGVKYFGEKAINNVQGEWSLVELAKGKSGAVNFNYDKSDNLTYMAFSQMDILEDRIEITPQISFYFADLPGLEIAVRPHKDNSSMGRLIVGNRSVGGYPRPYRINFPGLMSFHFEYRQDAERFADDLYFIQQAMQKRQNERRARFDAQAAAYRNAMTKPAVPEEQRKYVVQANSLSQSKEYVRALELYEKALDVDPVTYPGAYFNMALLSGQLKRYRQAVGYMQQYLQLVPDAKDARSAQDKIYEWELKMQK